MLKVWKFNDFHDTNEVFAHGVAHLPKQPCESIKCETWTVFGDWKYETLSFYLKTQARLSNMNVASPEFDQRKRLLSQINGTVIVKAKVRVRVFRA